MNYIYYTHLVSVILFMLHYLIKTSMLLMNSKSLVGYTKVTKVPEMIISLAFLGTGGYMLVQMPEIDMLMVIKIGVVLLSIPIAVVGFKKRKKILAVLALLMIIGAYGIAEISKKKRNQSNTSSTVGKEVYTANCAKCHGDDGTAGLMGSTDLSKSILDLSQTTTIIEEGKGTMVPYKETLTPEQVKAVAEYVQSLKSSH